MKSKKSEQGAWAKRNRRQLETRHSHEDALTNREFIQLLEGCEQLPEPYRFEARFICLIAGRLGLRGGQIAHLLTDWLDWDRKHIRIPSVEDCECGYCKRQARQEAKNTADLTYEEVLETRWHPKTPTSARVVPFDVSLRLEMTLERFANRFDAFPKSHQQSTGQ